MSAHALLAGAATIALASAAEAASPGAAPVTRAHARACATARATVRATARAWPAPLDRAVSWRGRDVPLGDALDRLAAAARVRLSYAADLIPLDRPVCAELDAVPLGDALVVLLAGVPVEPIAAGAGQVVLAPAPARATVAPPPASPPLAAAQSTGLLDRVLVTGTPDNAATRARTTSESVVRRAELAGRGATSVAALLGGSVPGVWAWEQAPSGLLARWGSLRGASSFGLSAPKVSIDGIPVANPLLLTQLDADVVDRVEVTRGPQGAALHGAGALGGAVDIVARHDAPEPGAGHVQLRSSAGLAGSDLAPGGALTQDHALALRYGSALRSAGLTLGASALGALTPGEATRRLAAYGDARLVGSRATLTALARLVEQRTGAPEGGGGTFLQAPGTGASGPHGTGFASRGTTWSGRTSSGGASSGGAWSGSPAPATAAPAHDSALALVGTAPQSLRQYTLGATLAFPGGADGRWTHTALVGTDGYRLADVAPTTDLVLSAADSALRAARGGADRVTARLTSFARFGDEATRAATLTLSAEESVLREATDGALRRLAGLDDTPAAVWRSDAGLSARGDLALRRSLFLTGGLRLERNDGYAAWTPVSLLPMLGAAVARDVGGATLKLRAAYGRGIRPAQSSVSLASTPGVTRLFVAGPLAPETQGGVEAGFDLLLGRRLGLHVTRFDQRASGLVQPMLVDADTLTFRSRTGAMMRTARLLYRLRNVGEIANRGWELQGTTALGRLALAGSLALVDSRVVRLATGYDGDLRPGDRMLEVPRRTASVSATWAAPRWSTSWTLSRASDWTAYDRLALDAAAADRPSESATGAWLRGFWRDYDGVTRLRASLSRDLFRGTALTLTGENLLDRRTGEPDNATVLPGRTVTLGARVRF